MAAASTVIHNLPSLGSFVNVGRSSSADDGDTIDTGLVKVDGMLMTTNTNDCVASLTSQSAGVATVALKTAGAAGSGVQVDWIAWTIPKNG
jgi:hypothetical protein